VTTRTRATPSAGSITTRAISGAATASASSTARRPGTLPRARLNTVAMIRIRATLANSDGSIWKPPGRLIQALAPLTSAPTGVSTASRASSVTP